MIMEDWNVRKEKLKEKLTRLSEVTTITLEDQHEQRVASLEKRLATIRNAILKLLSEV
jgi:hypothetical protein